jgi:hypothetical protein
MPHPPCRTTLRERRAASGERGGILLAGEPLCAVAALRGRAWRRIVVRDALPDVDRAHAVVSTRLFARRTVGRLHASASPTPGFEPAEPDCAVE